MPTNQRHTMSLFARQFPNVFLSTIILVGIANAQIIQKPADFVDNHLVDEYQRFSRGYRRPIATIDPDILEQARRTISHLSPAARRFLFSPTIQNTITNLNHNTNTNTLEQRQTEADRSSERMDRSLSRQLLGYVNPDSGAVEYDLRGKVKRICFIVG